MSLFKGRMDSGGLFTAQDDVRGLRIIAPGSLPSYWSVECGDGVDWYFWVNDSDELIMDNSAPTSTYDSVGNIVTGAGNSGANVTLSNLGTTAVNADLLPVTATYDLGGASNVWAESFVTKSVFYPTDCYITGTSAVATLTGSLVLGSDGDGYDLILYGETAGGKITWDQNAYTNVGALLLTDNVHLGFGAASSTTGDIYFSGDGTNLAIEAAADDVIIISGAASDVDWQWESYATSGQDMGWIADVGTFQLCDDTILAIGGATVLTADDGFTFVFDGTATLNVDAVTASDSFSIGESVVTDFELFGNAYDIIWDASEDEFRFGDNVEVQFGSSKDLQIECTGTVTNFTFIGTTGGMVVQPYAAATVAAIHIDGATNDWDGASEVGMLHISSDTALANAAASNLLVTHATAAPITDADGFLARFVSTGTARTNAYALDVVVTTTQPAMRLNSTVEITGVDTTANVLKLTGVDTTNNTDTVLIDHSGDGYAINIDLNEATSDGIKVEAFTNHTVPLILLDGDTAGFLGATDKGMLHIQNDIALANATASLLLIDNDTVKPINSALGYCFRIDDDAPVATTSPAWAAVIDSEDNVCLKLIAQNVPDGQYAFEIHSNAYTGTKSAGRSAYIHSSIDGTTDGAEFNVGIWTDIGAAATIGGNTRVLDIGCYSATGARATNQTIFNAYFDMQLDAATAASTVYQMGFNHAGQALTGFFRAANAGAVAFSNGAPGTADGYLTFFIGGGEYRIHVTGV